MRYLRQFKKLQTLSIKDNPVVTTEDFYLQAISFIPSLVYLDFRIIMEEEVNYTSLCILGSIYCELSV